MRILKGLAWITAGGFTAAAVAKAMAGGGNLRDIHGKTVLVTGGSRGLGLLLAREFARRGARVAICARHADQLHRAEEDLKSRGADVWAGTCDVGDAGQVRQLISDLTAKVGPIDILVNSAGNIQVGPASCMKPEDYEAAMRTIFWGALNTILAVLPEMRARRDGQIVNITSVGGKVSVPHLLPYGCAKFALVALSEGLRAELSQDGIIVTTVVPGLMRTGSHVNAMFKGRQQEEFNWFGLSASLPLISVNAECAARSIVRAVRRGAAEHTITIPAMAIARLQGLFPSGVASLLSLVNRFVLPGSEGGEKEAAAAGRDLPESARRRIFDALMYLGQVAAERYGQF